MKNKKQTKEQAPRSIRRQFPNVKTIIDAKRPIEVHVNAKDCKDGISVDSQDCALAKAMKREYHADAAVIGLSTSYLIKGNKAIRFDSGTRVAREIVSFDRHHDFEPGTYKLVPKAKSCKLGVKAHSGPKKITLKHEPKRQAYGTARVRLLSSKSGSR